MEKNFTPFDQEEDAKDGSGYRLPAEGEEEDDGFLAEGEGYMEGDEPENRPQQRTP